MSSVTSFPIYNNNTLCDYPCWKEISDNVYSCIVTDLAKMGAFKLMQALLSFAVRLYAGLPGNLAMKNNLGTKPFYKIMVNMSIVIDKKSWAQYNFSLVLLGSFKLRDILGP